MLIDYWMGHSNPSMGDRYGRQLVEDVEYRESAWALTYHRPYLGYVGYKRLATCITRKPPKCYNEQRVRENWACSSS